MAAKQFAVTHWGLEEKLVDNFFQLIRILSFVAHCIHGGDEGTTQCN